MRFVARMLPRMGDTERVALEAGTVWWDRELFSGDPDWKRLLEFQPRGLSEKERAFLDGPVQELCGMLDEWKVTQAGDLPREAWDFIKRHRCGRCAGGGDPGGCLRSRRVSVAGTVTA
jgi:acyl-CoA dehydrogenase